MNYAFVTLLSSVDYLNAVVALKRSLVGVQSKYPLIAMTTERISSNFIVMETLKRENIKIEIIQELFYSDSIRKKWNNHSVLNTASKISIFNLKNYDKLVYLDADCIFIKNADELFNYPDGAILTRQGSNQGGYSGLFVIIPQMHNEFELLKSLIENMFCFDGDLFDKLWFHVKTNDDYCIPDFIYCSSIDRKDLDFKKIKIIHLGHQRKFWWNDLSDDKQEKNIFWDCYRSLLK